MQKYKRLLIALAGFLAMAPFIDDIPFGGFILPAAFVIVLITAVFDVGRTQVLLVLGGLIAAPAVVSQVMLVISPKASLTTQVVSDATNLVLLGFITYRIVRDVLSHDHVTADTVRGTLCVYLLLGFVWWSAYSLIDAVDPHAFKISSELAAIDVPIHEGELAAAAAAREEGKTRLLYFSFVTLTTLGYGDITPVNPKALSLSVLEAIVGQLFVAVTIARAVGMHAAASRDRKTANSREIDDQPVS